MKTLILALALLALSATPTQAGVDFWTAGAPTGGCVDCLDTLWSVQNHAIALSDVALMLYDLTLYRCTLRNSGSTESVPSVIDPDSSSAGSSWRWHCTSLE